MSDFKINIGELNKRISVLELQKNGMNYSWEEARKIWAKYENLNKKNLFSQNGIGTKSVKFTIRAQNLTLSNSFRYKNDHYFLTDITEADRMYYEVTAAKVEPKICTVTRMVTTKDKLNRPETKPQKLMTFPGCVVEKYMGYKQEKPQTVSEIQYVSVTPKLIKLELADLIEIEGVTYSVQVTHTLDEYKNEYEIVRKSDI